MLQGEKPSDMYAMDLMELADQMDKMHIDGRFFNPGAKTIEHFFPNQ